MRPVTAAEASVSEPYSYSFIVRRSLLFSNGAIYNASSTSTLAEVGKSSSATNRPARNTSPPCRPRNGCCLRKCLDRQQVEVLAGFVTAMQLADRAGHLPTTDTARGPRHLDRVHETSCADGAAAQIALAVATWKRSVLPWP